MIKMIKKIFINPGHSRRYESGAVNQNTGLREADVAWNVGVLLEQYLNNVGIETTVLQSDNLYYDSPYGEPCVLKRQTLVITICLFPYIAMLSTMELRKARKR